MSHEFEKRRNGNLRTVGGPHTCATRWREGEKRLLTIALYLSGPVTGRWRDTAAVSLLKPIRQVINAIPSAMCERNGPEMCKRCRRLPTRERSSSTQLDILAVALIQRNVLGVGRWNLHCSIALEQLFTSSFDCVVIEWSAWPPIHELNFVSRRTVVGCNVSNKNLFNNYGHSSVKFSPLYSSWWTLQFIFWLRDDWAKRSIRKITKSHFREWAFLVHLRPGGYVGSGRT